MNELNGKLLIAEGNRAQRAMLVQALESDYVVAATGDGNDTLHTAEYFRPDVVLLAADIPGIDGYEVCRQLKEPTAAPASVILVSSDDSRAGRMRAFEAGADDHIGRPLDLFDLRARVKLHFRAIRSLRDAAAAQAEIESSHDDLKQIAQQRTREVAATQDIAVLMLAKLAESRDDNTGEHLIRMRSYAQILAEQLAEHSPYSSQIDRQFLDDLYRSSPLHDIGKVGIADSILLKPGKLTTDEFEVMKTHTIIGANTLDAAVFDSPSGSFLAMAALIARFHHERFDGSGYPAGLIGQEIPLPARIVAVADVYDALTTARPYKRAFAPLEAHRMIVEQSGKHFDPVVVAAFESRFEDFVRVQHHFGRPEPMTSGAMSFLGADETQAEAATSAAIL